MRKVLFLILVLVITNILPASESYNEQLVKDATKGKPEAQTLLGNCYMEGNGVEVDYEQGVVWYRKAAAQKFIPAVHNLGECYRYGLGVSKNIKLAMDYYIISAKAGYPETHYELGEMYRKGDELDENPTKCVEHYINAAERGHYKAAFELYLLYDVGMYVDKDLIESCKWSIITFYNCPEELDDNYEELIDICKSFLTTAEANQAEKRATLVKQKIDDYLDKQ